MCILNVVMVVFVLCVCFFGVSSSSFLDKHEEWSKFVKFVCNLLSELFVNVVVSALISQANLSLL